MSRNARAPSVRSSVNSVLDRIRRLSDRRERERTGLHFAEGLRPVLEALEASVPVETLLYSERLCWNSSAQKRVRLAARAGLPILRVTPEEFRTVSRTPRASGLGAVLRQQWTPLERIDPRRGICWLVMGSIRSPGNLGTILRTAEAAGAGGALFLDPSTDPFDPDVVRSTMGGIFRLEITRTSLEEFRGWARRHGMHVWGASPRGEAPYFEAPLRTPLAILLGEERQGLTSDEMGLATDTVRIPIPGRADSLNVGVAAGILLYEVLRRSP
jgi:RNA methyltransferase, TrmH family